MNPNRRFTDALLDQTSQVAREAAINENATLRFGNVTAVQTAAKTLTATVGVTTIRGIRYMASYSPAVSDTVWLLHQGSIVIAIGKF